MGYVLMSEPRQNVALLTLNRPAKRNALSLALMTELASELKKVAEDDNVRCVVITGD